MTIKLLYRYQQDEMTIDSLSLPDGQTEYIGRYRLVADENMVLTKDNEKLYSVIDINTEDLPNWVEIEQPEIMRFKRPF